MVEIRLIGEPAEVDAALTALAKATELHRSRRKPARGAPGQVIQYGVITLPRTGQVTP